MTLEWEQVIVHSLNPTTLGRWWAEALGWTVVHSSHDEFEIRAEPDRLPGWTSSGSMNPRWARAGCISTSSLMTRTLRSLV